MEYGLDARCNRLFLWPPAQRTQSHDHLTFGAMYQFSENFVQAFRTMSGSWKRLTGQ